MNVVRLATRDSVRWRVFSVVQSALLVFSCSPKGEDRRHGNLPKGFEVVALEPAQRS